MTGDSGLPDAPPDPSGRPALDAPYSLLDRTPTVEEFRRLRRVADLSPRSRAAVERGLPNTLFGAVVAFDPGDARDADDGEDAGGESTGADGPTGADGAADGDGPSGTARPAGADGPTGADGAVEGGPSPGTVGMARVVGDGGTVFHVCDMAVHPDHQRRGLGTALMTAVLAYLDRAAPEDAYVNLLADVDGFYERFGFVETCPASKAMYLPWPPGE